MNKKKKMPVEDEQELERMERDNGIERQPAEPRPLHEQRVPVGEDERDYFEEELAEQGYTDDGLEVPEAEKDKAGDREHGRKL